MRSESDFDFARSPAELNNITTRNVVVLRSPLVRSLHLIDYARTSHSIILIIYILNIYSAFDFGILMRVPV